MSKLGAGESAGNTALSIASMIPGPQQPFVAGASMLAPFIEKAAGGNQSSGTAQPSAGGSGIGLPQLLQLIQFLPGITGGTP